MEPLKNHNLCILAQDNELNQESLNILKEKCVDTLSIQTFSTKETLLNSIEKSEVKPEIVVLYHDLNLKSDDDIYAMYTIDEVKKVSPDSIIIIVSEKDDKEAAMKALKHGAQHYILKDQFLFQHIADSVNQSLTPSKI